MRRALLIQGAEQDEMVVVETPPLKTRKSSAETLYTELLNPKHTRITLNYCTEVDMLPSPLIGLEGRS